jgi:flagellar hook-associated protein 3 FlgL
MVTFGSPFVSSTFSRVSSVLARNVVLSNLRRTQEDLLLIQEQLSSGFLINRPSDDPVGSNRVLDFDLGLSRNASFLKNLSTAAGRLTMADASLAGGDEALNRARSIYLDQRGGVADAASRAQAADEVQLLLEDAVRLANARFEDRHLFGGSRTGTQPFSIRDGVVVFEGDLADLEADVSDGIRFRTDASAQAFGAVSDEIRGIDFATFLPADLDRLVTGDTSLSDLHGGAGAVLGAIQVTGALGTATVDLRSAKTAQDVVDLVNGFSAATGVTAGFNTLQNGFSMTGASVDVAEVGGGSTASELGILIAGGAGAVDGSDLDPRLTEATLLDDVLGAAMDSSGIVIENAVGGQTLTATFDGTVFDPILRVGDLLERLNASPVGVLASINREGTGIDVRNRISGGRLKILENGGGTAAQFGLLSTFERARLADLGVNGTGAQTGDGPDLRITMTDGQVLLVDVDGASTVRELVQLLNAQDPDLAVSLVGPNLDQIELVDSAGGAGTLEVQSAAGSGAAEALGIAGTAATTLTGTPVALAGVQSEGIFTSLIRLRDALEGNDVARMDAAARLFDGAGAILNGARGAIGSRILSLELTQNRLELEQLELEKLRSETRDVDLAEAATRFHLQQTILEAALASAARILDTHLLKFL